MKLRVNINGIVLEKSVDITCENSTTVNDIIPNKTLTLVQKNIFLSHGIRSSTRLVLISNFIGNKPKE
jgi:hypothetical protein